MNVFGRHCLYFDLTDSLFSYYPNGLIPYCIRPETIDKFNDEYKICYGEMITFKQLTLSNISIADLIKWNAVIEIIDLYEKYLLLPNLINDNEYYCNCSSPSNFGKSCQYTLNMEFFDDDERTLNVLADLWENNPQPNTCYIGISCQTNMLCLDWRQICNGIVDCDYGEDEPLDLCLEIELKEYNIETEFRCRNGFYIPLSLAFNGVANCPDRSDDRLPLVENPLQYLSDCSSYPAPECDEYNVGWKQFSCGDGQFISYSNLTSRVAERGKTCESKRDFMYLKQLFSPNNQTECWKSMMCLTGFDYLYFNIICSNQTIEIMNIERYCRNEYYFPSNSVVYSFVFFLYEKINRINWFNYTGPNYICYNKQFCENNILTLPTILKNNLICFHVNQTIFSWSNFYEYVIYLFSSCYTNFQASVHMNNKLLYKCHLSDTFISIYRVKDKRKDCFFNEDEDQNINLCLLNINDHFKCLTNESECIQSSSLMDKQYDCLDGSDESFGFSDEYCDNPACAVRSQGKKDPSRSYRFYELCDQIVNHDIFLYDKNETDETDCEYWSLTCNSYYTTCTREWNCKSGIDELQCQFRTIGNIIEKSFNCKEYEHYCIQLINNNNDINMTCLNISKAGDGIIDCIGGTDERLTTICTEKYSMDFRKRFYCMNSSICIKPNQVCDTIIDCPFEDDERICPWLFKSNSSKFYCNNSPLVSIDRCDWARNSDRNCQWKEQLWFCDLELQTKFVPSRTLISYKQYPEITQTTESFSFESIDSNNVLLSEKRILSSINSNMNMWLCNQGYPIQSLISNNKTYCLCSPAFYGDYCQYQSERLTILLQIQTSYYINPSIVFRFIIYLLNENNIIISYDEIVYSLQTLYSFIEHFLYLIDERMRNISLDQRSKSKFVRIDSYIIKETSVQYISSSLYPVLYSFLPVNRLSALLLLEDESFKIMKCKKKCSSHGKCMYYQNVDHIEYCWCEQGWYGDQCHLKSSLNLCNQTSCAPYSQCFILNDERKQIKCICPLGKSGNQCYIKYNSCSNVLCQNNGTCLSLGQQFLHFICSCEDGYSGTYCEKTTTSFFSRYISIPDNISHLTRIPAIIVILINPGSTTFGHRLKFLYKDVSLPIILQINGTANIAFIQMFHNISKSFYYMIGIRTSSPPWRNTSVISSNLCKNVSEIFNETILYKYSYLKRLKLYHLPCNENKDLRCFYDEYRMCLCTKDHNTDCKLFSHTHSGCNKCYNNGLCLQRDPTYPHWDYICLCSTCSFGSQCEFTTENYFITFDMLIGIEMKKGDVPFSEQPLIIHLVLVILLLILIFNLIFNTISLLIFSNKKLRQVGCDLYLLNLTITSEIGLILLFLRFIYMIIIQTYIIENDLFIKISCIFLEYMLRLIPSLFDWLTVCISIERAYIVIKDVHFTKILGLKTLKLSRWIISITILLNILTTLHRPFYITLAYKSTINRRTQDYPWCTLDFASTSWATYEKFINIFHLTLPLILNLISIISFLLYKTKLELTLAARVNESSRFIVLKQQLLKYKPLLISTITIIILGIPRFILTFLLACTQYDWQRYVYLAGYLISFLPLTGILFIYILPSPKYKKELQRLIKKRSNWSLFGKL